MEKKELIAMLHKEVLGGANLGRAEVTLDKFADFILKNFTPRGRAVQRQDDLTSQLLSVKQEAHKIGCYDAADFIQNVIQNGTPRGQGKEDLNDTYTNNVDARYW